MKRVFSTEAQCYGCGLCVHICAKDAIKMVVDDSGFFYPELDENLCIGCKKCISICPIKTKKPANKIIDAYIAQYSAPEVLKDSTSGGMFSALAEWIVFCGGVVYGARYDSSMRVEIQRAETQEEYGHFRGSKYVQCDMTRVYKTLEDDLKSNKRVLFVGTPCMVASVKNIFSKYDRLITVDLVCNGVSSPYIWDLFVRKLEKKHKDRVVDYKFRTKIQGYLSKEETAIFQSGRKIILKSSIDKYNTQIYYKNIATRPSCHECKFATIDRVGDFTIGDCHCIPNDNDISFEDGVSVLFVNTQVAQEILSSIGDKIKKQRIDLESAITLRMKTPIQKNEKSEAFLKNVKKRGLNYALVKNNGLLNWYRLKIICRLKRL